MQSVEHVVVSDPGTCDMDTIMTQQFSDVQTVIPESTRVLYHLAMVAKIQVCKTTLS